MLRHQVLDFVPRHQHQMLAISVRWHLSGRLSAHSRQIAQGTLASRAGSTAGKHRYSMRRISFPEWLEHRVEEVPDVTTIALAIARSGTAGASREGLEKVVRISPETLDELLRALVSAGQVVVVKLNGQRVFRAAM